MDHRQHLTVINRITIRIAYLSEVLGDVLAATEDSPLRSTPTDGGSRSVGSHSDPTPSAALRRRRNDERRQWERFLRNLDGESRAAASFAAQVTKRPSKIARCLVCGRDNVDVEPVVADEGAPAICGRCTATLNKACDRAKQRGETVDRVDWVHDRYRAAKTAILTTTTKGQ